MECSSLELTTHVVQRLFSRRISIADVRATIQQGQIIAAYPTDKPYPSLLLLHFTDNQPLHVVVAQDAATAMCVVITAYRPDPLLWDSNFVHKKK